MYGPFQHLYPYSNFHDLNLDWIISLIQQWAAEWKETQQNWEDQQEAFNSLKSYVENYFKNLDVQDEINNKLQSMADDGTLSEIISKYFSWAKIPEDYGAVGDGVADDTAALQQAFNNGGIVLLRGNYVITGPVYIHSNTFLLGLPGSSIIRKNNTAALFNLNYKNESAGDENITLFGVNITTTPGEQVQYYTCVMCDVNNLVIENCSFINNSVILKGNVTMGMWATYISGENIRINNVYIYTYNTGIYGDGLHFGSCKNVVASNIIAYTSDDCIVFAPINRFKPNKMNYISENITVSNVVCGSYAANCVRFGDIVEAGGVTTVMPSCVYHDCVVQDVVYTPGPQALLFAFVDARTGDAISEKGDNLTIRNVVVTKPFGAQQTSSAIIIQGLPFGASQTSAHNYGHIILDNIRYSHDSDEHAALYVYGVDFVEFKNSEYHDAVQKTVIAFLGLYNNKILFDNCTFDFNTVKIPIDWSAPTEYVIKNCVFTGTYYQASRTPNIPENGIIVIKDNEFDSTNQIVPGTSTSVALIYGSSSGGLSKFIIMNNTFYNDRTYFVQSTFYNSEAGIKWLQPNSKPFAGFLQNPTE